MAMPITIQSHRRFFVEAGGCAFSGGRTLLVCGGSGGGSGGAGEAEVGSVAVGKLDKGWLELSGPRCPPLA